MNFYSLLPDKVLQLRIKRYREIEGFLTAAEALALHRLACGLRPGNHALEIGSWKGKSTYCLARGLRGASTLHCIDPFDAAGEPGSVETYQQQRDSKPLRRQFEENLGELMERIEVHAGYSRDFVGRIPTVGLAFIDGDHSIEGARFDYENFARCVGPNGYLAFHDYYPDRPQLGPSWVIDNLVRKSGEFREFLRADSLWIGQRIH